MSSSTAICESLNEIAERLKQEARRLEQHRTVLEGQINQANRELQRVRAALRALGTAAESGRPGRKPAALTTRDIVQLIEEVLRSGAPATREAVREQVEGRARAAGRSLIGFHLRFGHALQDEKFVVATADGDSAVSFRPQAPGGTEKPEHTARRAAHNPLARSQSHATVQKEVCHEREQPEGVEESAGA